MDFVGAVIRNKIKELGQLWKSSENHVNVSIDVLNSWDTLISEWAEDESMPLIIRKGSLTRNNALLRAIFHLI
ncbi:hypothetical protein [uncultured Mediterranea sp.]|uniref:hypothetical protein n=1 Tax=uncultured Mediterranea sp. TaxID=1926662 RepID=UPI0028039296|nr:hypothetical protein [uncultured Mediterranea sp.]